jgi:DNA-binding MarR family transcriptional regulator
MEQKSIQRYISKLSNKVRRRLDVLSGQYGALTGAEGRVLNYLLAQNTDQFQRDIEKEFDLRASTAWKC